MNYQVEHTGLCKTYAALRHTAWHLLDHAKSYEEGRLLQLQACAVFCAFTFEAYLNHVGREEIGFWDEIDRIPYHSKLKVLAGYLHLEVDTSRRPLQTISELFGLRNRLAHGRTVAISEIFQTSELPEYDSFTRILPWEKITVGQVEQYLRDVDEAIDCINRARTTPDRLLWNEGGRSRVVGAPPPAPNGDAKTTTTNTAVEPPALK